MKLIFKKKKMKNLKNRMYNTENRCGGSKNGLQGRKIQRDTVNVVAVN